MTYSARTNTKPFFLVIFLMLRRLVVSTPVTDRQLKRNFGLRRQASPRGKVKVSLLYAKAGSCVGSVTCTVTV